MVSFSEWISEVNFFNFIQTLIDGQYFDLVFPFLLVYAILISILPRAKLFENKEGKTNKKMIILVSLIISIFGVTIPLPTGFTIGMYLALLFPNISTLTIGVLMLYIIGGIAGVDIFKGIFKKDHNAYLFFIIGAIGLGAVVFYSGIVLGFWSYDVYDKLALWNVTLALGLGILGIVLLIAGQIAFGILLLFVVITFILGDQEKSILYSFVDPVIFIVVVFIILLIVSTSDSDKKRKLAKTLKDAEKTREDYTKLYSGKPKDFDSRVFDILDESYKKNQKEWKEKYGDDKY